MAKQLTIIGILLIAAILVIGGSKLIRPDGSEPVSRNPRDTEGIESPAPRNSRKKASDLTLNSLCERLSKAAKTGTGDEVYRKIAGQLKELEDTQLILILGESKNAGCEEATESNLELAIVDALFSQSPELALDYVLSRYSESPERWGSFIEGNVLLGNWERMSVASLTKWLDTHRELLLTDKSPLIGILETAVLTQLVQSDRAAAIKRARSLPETQALSIIGDAFRQRSDLLDPDLSIAFLREALNGKGHEELVGQTCGLQLHSKGPDELRSFFRKHDATLAEREAILLQAVTMQVNMSDQGKIDDFIQRTRRFAEDEEVGNANELTAVILGTTADRDHKDKRAVDQLLGYKPGPSAIQIFLKARGNSLDKAQAKRINDYLESAASSVSPIDAPSPP